MKSSYSKRLIDEKQSRKSSKRSYSQRLLNQKEKGQVQADESQFDALSTQSLSSVRSNRGKGDSIVANDDINREYIRAVSKQIKMDEAELEYFISKLENNSEKEFLTNIGVASVIYSELGLSDIFATYIMRNFRFHKLDEVAQSIDKLKRIEDVSANIPPLIRDAAKRFSKIAQYIAQYFLLHSTYRKYEVVCSDLQEVFHLRSSFNSQIPRNIRLRNKITRIQTSKHNTAASELLKVADNWLKLIQDEQQQLQEQIADHYDVPNPFTYGVSVEETEDNIFTGRKDIVQQIEAAILGSKQAPTLLLHGPRRMGKTSILKQLPRLLGPNFAPAVMDCQDPAIRESVARLLRYMTLKISDVLQRRGVKADPLAVNVLEKEPYSVFGEWLDGIEKAMPAEMRVLLCLDKYERLQVTLDAGWGGDLLDTLRHILQHRPRFVLMFTGAHTFAELGPAWTDRFLSARRVRVSFLTPDEVHPLLTSPIPEFNMTYAFDALEAIVAATNCQPFLTQAVAFELVQYLNEPTQQRKEATPADVEEAITRALSSAGEYFANVWSDVEPEGQNILRALINGEATPDFPVPNAGCMTMMC